MLAGDVKSVAEQVTTYVWYSVGFALFEIPLTINSCM